MLDTALPPHVARFRRISPKDPQIIVKGADGNNPSMKIVIIPQIKQFTQKLPICLRQQGVFLVSLLLPDRIQTGNELEVTEIIFTVKLIDFPHAHGSGLIYNGQNIILCLVAVKQLNRLHDLGK